MAALHLLAAQLALLLALIGLAWLLWLAATHRPAGTMLYGALVWVVIAIGGGGLAGLVIALTGRPPADPLHPLYGALAAGALPAAALFARDRPAGQQTAVLAIGLVVLVILIFRLFQTGG